MHCLSGWTSVQRRSYRQSLHASIRHRHGSDYVSGACLLVRKSVWEEVGGFDLRFAPAYYEDTDLAFMVRSRGYSVVVQPQSVVVHVEGASHGTDPGTGVKRFQERNRSIFLEKWRSVLEREHLGVRRAVGRPPGEKGSCDRPRRGPLLPRPDWDAGSRFVFSYLELLAARGYEVVYTSDISGDEAPYGDALRQRGIEYVPGPWTPESD